MNEKENEILKRVEQGISEKVTPANRDTYDKTVLAGMKILFNEKTHPNLELIKNPQSRTDPVNTISAGIAGLMWILYMMSKKTMPMEVLVLSGVTLMARFMDFAERGLGIQITNELVAATTKKLAENLFKKLGITPDQLNEAIAKGHKEIIDSGQGNKLPPEVQLQQSGAI